MSIQSRQARNEIYRSAIEAAVPYGEDVVKRTFRRFATTDLFFLLTHVLRRPDVNNDWLYDRCNEVQSRPNGYLDLWARGHYKSTLITFGLTIFELLSDPELTFCIFSHKSPAAKDFLSQIKTEFEQNERVKYLFDDILYQNPQKEADSWSLDGGLVLKRKGNPKEPTISTSGLVDGQAIGMHFNRLIYDDVVVPASVSTPEMIKKTTNAFKLSLNLVSKDDYELRGIGTRYHYNDTYRTIIEDGILKPRIHKATVDGTATGEPVFFSKEELAEKRRHMGGYIFGCQMLQDPKADGVAQFRKDDIRYYDKKPQLAEINIYIVVDPANEKKKTSDYTCMWVIGLGPDKNYYVLDGLRDRLNLTERTEALFDLVSQYFPLNVGYEKYGLQSDIQHIEYVQDQKNYHFSIVPVGGSTGKTDRILGLVPSFEEHRWYYPKKLLKATSDGKVIDLVKTFIDEEFVDFPVVGHDDMLDAKARILAPELKARWPLNNGAMDTDFVHDGAYC